MICSSLRLMVCVCVFSSHSFWTSSSLDVPAEVTQEEGHTGVFHSPSFCGACLNFSREKDSAICFLRRPCSRNLCTNDLIVLHSLDIFIYFIFCEKSLVYRHRTHVPTCQKVTRLPLSYRGDWSSYGEVLDVLRLGLDLARRRGFSPFLNPCWSELVVGVIIM